MTTHLVRKLQEQARAGKYLFTIHAVEEMIDEMISSDEVLEALVACRLIEDYPHHQRGPCCLVSGKTLSGRPLHIVCTTALPNVIIITVYEPKAPKWRTPEHRGEKL